jgi:hypothetical protein
MSSNSFSIVAIIASLPEDGISFHNDCCFLRSFFFDLTGLILCNFYSINVAIIYSGLIYHLFKYQKFNDTDDLEQFENSLS